MTALVQDEGLVVHVGADLAHLLPDVPEARVLVELVEPVRRGSARPLDPERLTAPDKPLNVGVRVVGAEPAGAGASACPGGGLRSVPPGSKWAGVELPWGKPDDDRGRHRLGGPPPLRADDVVIALIGALVCLRAGYRYDRSIGRHPVRSGVKRLAFWALLFLVEYLVVMVVFPLAGPLVAPAVFGYVLAAGLIGPWVVEYYRRRAT